MYFVSFNFRSFSSSDFENHMGVTFDNDVDFQDICEVLDPDNTQRI